MAGFDPDAYLGGTSQPAEKKKKSGGFDPDAYLAGPKPAPTETATQSFGRGAASLADSAINAATGFSEWFNYPFQLAYRGAIQGKPLAQASAEATRAVALPKDIIGRMTGVTGTAGYENAPLRQIESGVGQVVSENVIQPTAQAFNVPEEYVGNMLNSLAIGVAPVAGRVAAPVGRAVKATVQAPVDIARGAVGSATGAIARPGAIPEPWQTPSSRIPLKETYIPAEGLEQLKMNPALTPADVSRPTTQLAQTLPERGAMAISGGQVPVQGQAMRAFGERLGETYRNPMTALADVGTAALTGVPFFTAGKALGAGARAFGDYTMSKKGFSQITPEQRAAIDTGQNPWAAGPVVPEAPVGGMMVPNTPPLLPYSPAGQTPIPMGGPQRVVNIEGNRSVMPYNIDVTNSQTARPMPSQAIQPRPAPTQSIAPKPTPMVTSPVAPESVSMAPAAPVQETIIQKAQRVMGDKYKAPKTEPTPTQAPVAAPVKPTPVAKTESAPVNTPVLKGTAMTNEYGEIPVSGDAYYQHYTQGGLTPREAQYSPGTLAETLYNKVKQDPKSLTKQDIENWYAYDHNTTNMPDLTATKATKKSAGTTEAEKVASESNRLAQRIIKNYESVQAQATSGRPELVGKTVEEAKLIDAKKSQDVKNNKLKEDLKEIRTAKEQWDSMTTKQQKDVVSKGGRNPYTIIKDEDITSPRVKKETKPFKRPESGLLNNPMKPKDAKVFIEEKTKNNEAYNIFYKKGLETINEQFIPEGQTFKLDPSIKMFKVTSGQGPTTVATGVYKDNIPAKAIIDTDKMTVEIYTTVNGTEQLHKKINIPKGE